MLPLVQMALVEERQVPQGRHGEAFYVNELAQGVSQAQVALQIAQSQEAQVHLVEQIELGWHLA